MNDENDEPTDLPKFFVLGLKGVLALLLIAAALLMFSCNSVKKSASKHIEKVDSSAVVSKDSSRLVKSDSTGSKLESGEYERETVYAYDTIYYTEPGRTDTIIKYVPRIITVKEKGTYNKAETASKSSVDSSGKNEQSAVAVKKEVKDQASSKKSTRVPWWLLVVAVLAGYGYWAYRRYFS